MLPHRNVDEPPHQLMACSVYEQGIQVLLRHSCGGHLACCIPAIGGCLGQQTSSVNPPARSRCAGSATPVSAPHGRPHPRPLGTHHVVRGVGGAAAADPACRSPATAAAAGAAAPTACSTADDGQPSPDGVRTLASMLPWPESTAAVVGAASLLPGREGYAGVSANASAAAASGGSPVEARRLQSRHSGLGGGAGGPGGHGGSSSGPGRGPGPPAPSGKLPGLVLPVQRAGSSAAAVQDNPYMTIGNLLYG